MDKTVAKEYKCILTILNLSNEWFKFDEAASRVIPIGYNPGSKGTIAKLASNAVEAKKKWLCLLFE